MEGDEYFNLEEEPSDWSGKLKFSHLCRVCANPNGYLIPIFEGEGLDHELGMKIQKHLPIQVFEIDSLPKQMCYQCASTLIAWHDLTIGCIEADKKLRQLQCEKQQEQQQSQVQDSEDDKVTEFFDTPSVEPENIEPEKSDVTITQSRTAAESSPSLQTQVEKKIPCTKKKRRVMEKPSKVKMVLLRGPTAGPSRHLTATKSQSTKALDIVKAKGGTTQEFGTTERCPQSPLRSFAAFHEAQNSWKPLCKPKDVFQTPHPDTVYIKTEKNHSVGNKETCLHCSITFVLKSELATHISTVHSDLVYHCEICDTICYGNKHQFIEHLNNHTHNKRKTKCEADTEAVNTWCSSNDSVSQLNDDNCDLLENSSKISNEGYNGNKGFACSVCKKVVTRSFDLKRHMKIHASPKPVRKYPDVQENSLLEGDKKIFPCNVCGRVLTRKFDLQRHINTHISKNTHLETIFGIDNTYISDDSNNMAHLESKLENATKGETIPDVSKVKRGHYPCNICQKSFTRKFDLKRHGKQHTPDELAKNVPIQNSIDYEAISRAKVVVDERILYRCDQCNKHLYTRASYIKHLRIHTGEKPFTCHVCGKQFRTLALLNRHVKDVHEGIKKYPCDICGRKFAHKRAKNEHRRVHTGERPCVCHLCGKAFKTKASLYVHSKFHMDFFPHSCPHCDKQFRRRHHLNVHMLLHTGEKPHVCHICGKCFRLSKTLKDHIVIHTNKETFECSLCGKHFAQERYLKNHARSHRTQIFNISDHEVNKYGIAKEIH